MVEVSQRNAENPAIDPFGIVNPRSDETPVAAQSKAMFDTIAVQANMLRGLLANLRQKPERHRDLNIVFADLALAEVLTNQIGALADQMVGGQVVGSLGTWVVGSQFERAEG